MSLSLAGALRNRRDHLDDVVAKAAERRKAQKRSEGKEAGEKKAGSSSWATRTTFGAEGKSADGPPGDAKLRDRSPSAVARVRGEAALEPEARRASMTSRLRALPDHSRVQMRAAPLLRTHGVETVSARSQNPCSTR